MLAMACVPFVAQGAEITWSGASNTAFNNGANWVGGVAPANSYTNDVAVFGAAVTPNQPIVSSDQNLGGLKFLSTNGGWTISGSKALSFSMWGNGTNLAFIDDSANTGGTDTISNTINLTDGKNGNIVFNGGAGGGGNLVFAGAFNANASTYRIVSGKVSFKNLNLGGNTLQKEGPGTMAIDGGPTNGAITLNGGKLVIGSNTALGTGQFTLNRGGEFQASTDVTIANRFQLPNTDGTSYNVCAVYGVISGSNNITFTGTTTGEDANNTPGLANNLASGKTLTFSNVGISPRGRYLSLYGSGDTVFAGVISNGSATNAGITFANTGTTTLKATNTFTGGITISAGKVTLNGATGSLVSTSAMTFNGTGIFNYDNVGAAEATNQALGTLTFSSGDATIQTTRTAAFNVGLSFSNLPARSSGGGTRNFVYAGTVGDIGTNSKISFITAPTASQLIGPGTFFGGSNYAAYDSAGFVRAMNYTTDNGGSNAIVSTSYATFAAAGATNRHVDLGSTGTISAAGSETINTLRIGGSNTVTLASGSTLTISNGGILKTGGNASTISGGTQLQSASATDLVIRTDTATDSLTIDTPISNPNASTNISTLTKTGAGTLTLNGAVSLGGGITIQNGTLFLGNTLSGPISVNGGTLDIGAGNRTVGAVTLTNDATITSSTGVLTSTSSFTLSSGTVSAILAGGSTGLTKTNAYGLVTLTRSNSYTGTTTVSAGILNIQNSDALGSTAGGTTVSSGGTLQLQGGINVTNEALTLNGTGVNNAGTLNNGSGNNTWGGTLTLAGTSRINSEAGTLTISNASAITGSGFGLSVGGYGNTKIDSAIQTGSGTLTKDMVGKLTLSASNNYTGLTTVSYGILNIQNASALGTSASGTTVSSGGTLQLQGGIIVANETLSLKGVGYDMGGALQNVSGDNTWTGTVTNSAAARINSDAGTLTLQGGVDATNQAITFGGAGNIVVSGAITNSTSTLTKDGTGTLTLSGANTYSGATVISAGTLQVGNGTDAGSIGATASITNNGALVYNVGSGTRTNAAVISGAGALTQNSSGGTLKLTGSNTYTGATVISAGTLQIGDGTNAGSIGSTSAITNSGALVYNVGSGTRTNGAAINGNGTLTQNSSGGTLILAGANSYTGTTTVSAGVLVLTNGGAIADTGAVSLSDVAGATLSVATSETIGSLRGGGAAGGNVSIVSSKTLTVAETGSQTFAGVISNAGALTKSGAGTLTLTATNTYTGATTVAAGKLVVNGSISNSAVTVSNGAVLGGTGPVGATVVKSGGTIAPGNSPGIETINGNLTWEGGAKYDWEIFSVADNPGTSWDLINVTNGGVLNLADLSTTNKFTINLFTLSALPNTRGLLAGFNSSSNYSWKILSSSSISGTNKVSLSYFAINAAGFSNAPTDGLFGLELGADNASLYLTYTGGSAVPEPGTWAAGTLLAAAAGFVRWRRRNSSGRMEGQSTI